MTKLSVNPEVVNQLSDERLRELRSWATQFEIQFGAIPDERWYAGGYISPCRTKRCVLGHAGVTEGKDGWATPTDRAKQLEELYLAFSLWPATVNDIPFAPYTQETPKARIMASLTDILFTIEDRLVVKT